MDSVENKAEVNVIKITVPADYKGTSLLKYLKKTKIGIPYGLLQKLLRKKAVRVNGKRVKEDHVLEGGEEITIPAQAKVETKRAPYEVSEKEVQSFFTARIIYEDKNCLAIDKMRGLPSQGGSKVGLSVDAILQYLNKKNSTKYSLVHRLDKDTTGVLLIAKHLEAARILGDSFKYKFIEKKYVAIVKGKVQPMEGAINFPLGKRAGAGGNEKVIVDEFEGKKAYTEYRVIESYGKVASMLELEPHTGRKHQIRVHLNAIGHPIIGDGKYGGAVAFVEGLPEFILLHSWKLKHKENYFKGTIEAKLPKAFNISEEVSGK